MPILLNRFRVGLMPGTVYIGRPTKWGNPYLVSDVGREAAVSMFRIMLVQNTRFQAEIREKLSGKNLLCWCAPRLCHGHLLLHVANSPEGTTIPSIDEILAKISGGK